MKAEQAESLILGMPEGMWSRDVTGGKGSQKYVLCPVFKG